MARIVRLTERDLTRLVRRVIREENLSEPLIKFSTSDDPIVSKLYDNKQLTGIWYRTKNDDGVTVKPNNQSKTYYLDAPNSDLFNLPLKGSYLINVKDQNRNIGVYYLELHP